MTALWAIAGAIVLVAIAVVIAGGIVAGRHVPRSLTDDEIRARLAPVAEPLFIWPNSGPKVKDQ